MLLNRHFEYYILKITIVNHYFSKSYSDYEKKMV